QSRKIIRMSSPTDEEINDPFLGFCCELIENTYDDGEFKDRMNCALPILYERPNNSIRYLLGLIVTDTDIESIENHNAYTREYRRIKQFVEIFEELIGDYELLIKIDYIIVVYEKINKVRHDDNGNNNIEYMYESTDEQLEIYEFVKLFYAREEAGFRAFDARMSSSDKPEAQRFVCCKSEKYLETTWHVDWL
ncbi:3799_t:CDS:2, partial [Gigaspora rosea]